MFLNFILIKLQFHELSFVQLHQQIQLSAVPKFLEKYRLIERCNTRPKWQIICFKWQCQMISMSMGAFS